MNLQEAYKRIERARTGQFAALDLSGCALTEVPPEVWELTHLTELKLGHWADYNKQNRNRLTYIESGIRQLTQLQNLDLSSNELHTLPDELMQLQELQWLDLSNNQFEQIPHVLSALQTLHLIDLANNRLSELSSSIFRLQNLQRLNLSKNILRQIPDELGVFAHLQRLDLSHNYLTVFPDAILGLSALQQLSMIGNQIGVLPDNIDRLSRLRLLYLNNNSIDRLPPAFAHLRQLQRLYMSSNTLNHFPQELLQINDLQLIDLRNNLIEYIPNGIEQLQRLEYLDLAQNRLKALAQGVTQLPNLQLLDLRNNQISILPSEIARMPALQYLYVNDNPIESPPPEIAGRGLSSIRTYFRELEKTKETDYLYEIKLLLVGEGRVGKTSLSKSLTIPDYALEDHQSTEGIDIHTWIIPKEDIGLSKDFRINLWDFGGQEIYHATHQFFLTKRSIYLLVTESRKEDKHEDFYYWLNIVRILGDKSPVIIALNKCDQPVKELPIKEYRKTFDNIVGFNKISCHPEYRNTIDLLQRRIKQVIGNRELLPHLGTALPKVWIDIRAELDTLREEGVEHISYKEYLRICKKYYQDEETAIFLSEFFHDLGVILHFTDDPDLRETIFLNHDWVTRGVYNVLDNQRVKNKLGNFTDNDLAYIWQHDKYKDQRKALLALMKNTKFELCFEIKPGHYLAPQLLPVDEIDYEWNGSVPQLHFEYRYHFMPKGILTRLIVKRHKDIYNEMHWRYGVLLERENTRALIRELYFDRKISIVIEGEQTQAMLEVLRQTMDDINGSFNNLQLQEMVQCQCTDCQNSNTPHFYRLALLQKYEQRGKTSIDCEKSLEPVSVRQVLQATEPPKKQQKGILYEMPRALPENAYNPDEPYNEDKNIVFSDTVHLLETEADSTATNAELSNANLQETSKQSTSTTTIPIWLWVSIGLAVLLLIVLIIWTLVA